ncbi:MAG: TetR/AcrR family transcriptional regulator [Acidimicrobiales bacterium]
MTTASPPRTRGGRPRDPRVDDAVGEAVLELLGEQGWRALTVAQVAERAGVGRASIYRRWTTKEAMIAHAWRASTAEARLDAVDTGSFAADLRALVHRATEVNERPVIRRALPHLLAAAADQPELTPTVVEVTIGQMLPVAEAVERAKARGEVDPAIDTAALLDHIFAPLVIRTLVEGRPRTTEEVDRHLDLVLAAFTTTGARRPPP